jgi:hypothetical protein
MARAMSGGRWGGLKQWLGPRATAWWRIVVRGYGVPRWGNLRRARPFSSHFGFERGTPVDRFYLEAFLTEWQAAITGDVLEIQAPDYARRYGHALGRTESVDILPQHQPTWCCDLADAGGLIPDAHYDCVLLPNTLSVLQRAEGCLQQAWRITRPGGVILATGALLMPLAGDVPEYQRLTANGWRDVVARAWPGATPVVRSHGNMVAAIAAMLGLAYEELTVAELQADDPQYPVMISLAVRKPSAEGPR